MKNGNIIVVIPTLNASNILLNQLDKLSSQILVVDSSSDDDTIQIAQKAGIKVLEIKREEFNHATTRNLVLTYDVDFYIFMTQDAIPYDDKLVENLLKSFDDENIVVSYAKQVPHESADVLEKFARNTNYPDASSIKSKESIKELGIKTFFSSNTCAMYRASYFKKVGGFTEGLIMNEDMEFAARAILDGKKVSYSADAKVWHSHEYKINDIFKRYFDIGIFFKTNLWIQDEANKYSSTQSTGIKQAKKELNYLLKNSPFYIPKSILFSLTKYIAYKMGYMYDKLPSSIRKLLSLHKNWHKTNH